MIQSITVGNLLSHTARITREDYSEDSSKENIIAMLNEGNFLLPGTTIDLIGNMYNYSNIGYNTLAEIIATKALSGNFNPGSLAANNVNQLY